MDKEALRARAKEAGVELERRPSERIVVTGFHEITPLGDTAQTWQGLLEGKSAVKEFNVNNSFVNIAAPVIFDASEHADAKAMRRGSTSIKEMAKFLARESARQSGLLEDGKLSHDIDKKRVGTWVGSGVGSTQYLIDAYLTIHQKNDSGEEDTRTGSRRVSPFLSLQVFPEEINASVAIELGLSGWGGSSVEACATGLSNIVEAVEKIRNGHLDIAFAGRVEDPFDKYPEVGIDLFAAMREVLSTRNDDPERASRPFDRDRDGFVLASGGGIVVLESLEHAIARGAPIYAEVLGWRKSMDGVHPTDLDRENVARTIMETIYNEREKDFYNVDAIFAHATSTQTGDVNEAEVFKRVFGEDVGDIPITAIKSNMGHLGGGAGAVNAIAAVQALNAGEIPHILNLDNPMTEAQGLFLVRGEPLKKDINTALVLAYGFGGHNAALLLGKYKAA